MGSGRSINKITGGSRWISIRALRRVFPPSRLVQFRGRSSCNRPLRAYDAKKITKAQLEEEQNAAVADTIKRFEATGSPIITDGEQRVSSFATYPIADTLVRNGAGAEPGPGRPIFRDLCRWPQSAAAQDHRRPIPLQFLRRRSRQESRQDDQQAASSSGNRAIDDVSALPARWRSCPAIRANNSRTTSSMNVRKTFGPALQPVRPTS